MKKSVVLSMALASLIGSMAAQDAVAAPANADRRAQHSRNTEDFSGNNLSSSMPISPA